MQIRQLAMEVSKETGIPQREIWPILIATLKVASRIILEGHAITFTNLFRVFVDVVPEKRYHDANTNTIKIRPKKFKLFVKISPAFKKKIDAKKAY